MNTNPDLITVNLKEVKSFFNEEFQEALDLILKNNPPLVFHKLIFLSNIYVLEYMLENPSRCIIISTFDSYYNPTINEFMNDIKKGFMKDNIFIPRFSSANELKMKYLLKRT